MAWDSSAGFDVCWVGVVRFDGIMGRFSGGWVDGWMWRSAAFHGDWVSLPWGS